MRWVINDRILILGLTIPLIEQSVNLINCIKKYTYTCIYKLYYILILQYFINNISFNYYLIINYEIISYTLNMYFKVWNSFQPTGFMNTVYTFVCII